jgi:PTH1 family peptidyl-tRNA hydrolase
MSKDVWLLVGLGNPGPGYSGNRHNVGQMVLDTLAKRIGANFKAHKSNSVVAEARLGFGGPKIVLAKPLSYMNTSGGPVSSLAKFYSVDPSQIVVVHDELDIDPNQVRIKFGGGHAGHNGLRDIIAAIGTQDFVRVRVGIGRPPGRQEVADFVLKDFSAGERTELPVTLEIAADALQAIVESGVQAAQQKFNAPS